MHFLSIPARVGDHDGGNSSIQGIKVRRHVDPDKGFEGADSVVLIDSFCRATISNVVLRTSSNIFPERNSHETDN